MDANCLEFTVKKIYWDHLVALDYRELKKEDKSFHQRAIYHLNRATFTEMCYWGLDFNIHDRLHVSFMEEKKR